MVLPDTEGWQQLANALRALHRALLERARRGHEQGLGTALAPAELLQLLTTNADWAWLRNLSGLMSDIDIIHDAGLAHRNEMAPTVRAAVEHLISESHDPVSPFARRYWQYVREDPDVAVAHARLKQTIATWPGVPEVDSADLLHERHRLAERARHLTQR